MNEIYIKKVRAIIGLNTKCRLQEVLEGLSLNDLLFISNFCEEFRKPSNLQRNTVIFSLMDIISEIYKSETGKKLADENFDIVQDAVVKFTTGINIYANVKKGNFIVKREDPNCGLLVSGQDNGIAFSLNDKGVAESLRVINGY